MTKEELIDLLRREAVSSLSFQSSQAVIEVLNSIKTGEGLDKTRDYLATMPYSHLCQAVFELSNRLNSLDTDLPIILNFVQQHKSTVPTFVRGESLRAASSAGWKV